ncbi:MAG: hypothetical protein UT63_C0016G0005 [Candidatus Gottesmanbacteria bacterium GW2011_GWC2_39_8]|uniref:Uncharacterized protein n=1 Tax=Candidatus Gottesmanbacteria bacterium GW2011_GWC2_39_8 TaxID=1618450 RepID=A0A0G0Q808_9BACT|nr:MAG: hypothetical protein UT63_C0016G0005 [Candidatus Gottesmanbacteria bacterium GW2011_GWC2_39_8]
MPPERNEILRTDTQWQKRVTRHLERSGGYLPSRDIADNILCRGSEEYVLKTASALEGAINLVPVWISKKSLCERTENIVSGEPDSDYPDTISAYPCSISSGENGKSNGTTSISIRSRGAQLGLEVRKLWVLPGSEQYIDQIRDKVKPKPEDPYEEWPKGYVKGLIEIGNVGPREVTIKPMDEIANIFSTVGAPKLTGRELEHLVKRMHLGQGEWYFVGKNYQKVESVKDALGIALKVSNKRKKIKPGSDIKGIFTSDDKPRENVDNYLEDIPYGEKADFWVSETPHITLPNDVVGVLDPVVKIGDKYADHLYSHEIHQNSDWKLRVEVSERGLSGDLDYDDTWVMMNFYKEAYPAKYFESPGVLKEDAVEAKLQAGLPIIQEAIDGKTEFPKTPVSFHYSTQSQDKLYAAACALVDNSLLALPPSDDNLTPPPEINLETFSIDYQTQIAYKIYSAMAGRFQSSEEIRGLYQQFLKIFNIPPHFKDLPLNKKAEFVAKSKAVLNEFVGSSGNNLSLATDVMGEVQMAGEKFMLDKTSDQAKQREALEKISKSGMIQGTVGIAIAEIPEYLRALIALEPEDIERRLREVTEFETTSVNFRIKVDLKAKDIDRLMADKEELSKSAFVFDVFGKLGQNYVKAIEIEDPQSPTGWREIYGFEAWSLVHGFPGKQVRTFLEQTKAINKEAEKPKQTAAQLEMIKIHLSESIDSLPRIRRKRRVMRNSMEDGYLSKAKD